MGGMLTLDLKVLIYIIGGRVKTMITKSKYKIARIQDRTPVWAFVDNKPEETVATSHCFVFLPEVFTSSEEADEFRSLKDYPEDYLIFRVW